MSQEPETPAPTPRSTLRAVGLPSEHGGWGLTLEPVLLGLLVAPSVAGAALGGAAVLAFLARTPLRFVLVDVRRGRRLDRTVVAARLAAAEVLAIAGLTVLATVRAAGPFWAPLLAAVPLVAVEAVFDARSRSRRLAPELAGAVGISAVAAAIALADDTSAPLAWGLSLVLAARVLTAVPATRHQVLRLHGRPDDPRLLWVTDGAALAVAGAAVALDDRLLAGGLAVAAVVAIQRLTARHPPPRAVVLGLRQLALGLAVVAVTALGVHLS